VFILYFLIRWNLIGSCSVLHIIIIIIINSSPLLRFTKFRVHIFKDWFSSHLIVSGIYRWTNILRWVKLILRHYHFLLLSKAFRSVMSLYIVKRTRKSLWYYWNFSSIYRRIKLRNQMLSCLGWNEFHRLVFLVILLRTELRRMHLRTFILYFFSTVPRWVKDTISGRKLSLEILSVLQILKS
jgi:hypothetical protein